MAFYNEINDQSNFVIGFTSSPKRDFGIFAKAYAEAASSLSEYLLSKSRFSDYEAYPIVFLYRNALELSLKNIIYKALLLSSFRKVEVAEQKLPYNHDLRQLSSIAASVLHVAFPSDPDIEMLVEEALKVSDEFAGIDQSSFSYRYPIDKHGNRSTKHHQVLNLRSMNVILDPFLDRLDTVNFGLNSEIDFAEDVFDSLLNL